MTDNVLDQMLNISVALSSEKDTAKLLESILLAAKQLTHADGGTIYSVNEQKELVFDTLFNDSLDLHWGGSTGEPIQFSPIPMYVEGTANTHAIVARAAVENQVINIPDIYQLDSADLEAAKRVDQDNNYRTQSVLTVPMVNHEGDINGVLQLINAQDDQGIIAFSEAAERSVVALASLASVALTNRQLIDTMEALFQSFTQLIAKAIDEKSPYTGGHCRRVPELTMMIAEAVHRHDEGPLASFKMSDADRHELNLAGWIHDCGKVATPEYIMDKSKKLETIFDRIALVEARFEVARRDIELSYLQRQLEVSQDQHSALQAECAAAISVLEADFIFVKNANTGGEFMDASDQERLRQIGNSRTVTLNGVTSPLLTEEEIYNLQTARGTLNAEERAIINRHMDITVEMLESLPFPKHLKRVPEFAGGHHEKMDGTGYPKGLTRDEMSIPARMMAIADIFEALTAADRPYKDAKKLSECLTIMGKMRLGDHIDPDLFEVFVKQKVHIEYAERFLKPEQMDDMPIEQIPGFS